MTRPMEENNPKGQERIKHRTHRIKKNTFGVDMKLYDTSNEKKPIRMDTENKTT